MSNIPKLRRKIKAEKGGRYLQEILVEIIPIFRFRVRKTSERYLPIRHHRNTLVVMNYNAGNKKFEKQNKTKEYLIVSGCGMVDAQSLRWTTPTRYSSIGHDKIPKCRMYFCLCKAPIRLEILPPLEGDLNSGSPPNHRE
jgi:hypothetical protein